MHRFDMETFLKEHPTLPKFEDVESVPVRFLRTEDLSAQTGQGVETFGRLPEADDDVLLAIHALQPKGAQLLQLDQVYVRYMEAANDSFIAGRWMFLDESTLRNICQDADAGFAFMNSHRTGGWSGDAELPFGRTFGGRFERWTDSQTGRTCRRSVVGVYMRKGVDPNGNSGPSTDAMAAMIDAGTVFDVSVGLYGGERICDVCGNGLYSYDRVTGEYLCPHAPATSRGMTAAQTEAQKARGVPNGYCSFSLSKARCGEVSAVYDGAVSRAGFLKALALANRNALSVIELGQARNAYQTLLSKGDFEPMDFEELKKAISDGFQSIRESLSGRKPEGDPAPAPAPAPAADPALTAQITALTAQMEAQNALLAAQKEQTEALQKKVAEEQAQARFAAADAWITDQVRNFRLTADAGNKLRKLAKETPDAFEAMKPVILTNGKVVSLAGLDARPSGTISGDDAQTALALADPDTQLTDLAMKRAEEKKISYSEALRQIAVERPDLIAAKSAQEG